MFSPSKLTAQPAMPPATPLLIMYSLLCLSSFRFPEPLGTMASSFVGQIFGSRETTFLCDKDTASKALLLGDPESWRVRRLSGIGLRFDVGSVMKQALGKWDLSWTTELERASI
jgi:hypothetical protein